MANLFWLIVIVGGPILVGLAIAYGLMKRRRLTEQEKIAQHDAVDRIYHSENPPETGKPETQTNKPDKRKEFTG